MGMQRHNGFTADSTLSEQNNAELANTEDEEAIASGARAGGREEKQRLELVKAAVGSLSEQTQQYLHINAIGGALPKWMIWQKRPKLNRWNFWMGRLYSLMNNSPPSTWGGIITNFMIFTIVVSVASFCLETVPSFQEDREPAAARAFTIIEAVTIQIFAADYLLRFISCPQKLRFIIEPFNIIDLIAIVPWYVVTFVGTDFDGTTVFRVVRLFRVFRVLKLGGRYSKLLVVLTALKKSLDMLGLMVFFVSLLIVFFATLMYYAERGSWNDELGYFVRPNEVQFTDYDLPKPSPFESIVSGFWWAIVTLMTVGYGDYFPITAGGKAIACVAMICGILTLALPISVIGSTFSSDWTAHTEEEKRMREAGKKAFKVTSPELIAMQKLLTRHVEDIDTLVELNQHSEVVLEEAASKLHSSLKTTKKHLRTEANADLRLRRISISAKNDTAKSDPQYGYLTIEHVKDRYREQLPSMAETSKRLSTRAGHVTRMKDANSTLLDPELEALVSRLAKKHADLAFLLDKHEEQATPLNLLEGELKYLKSMVKECEPSHALASSAHGSRAQRSLMASSSAAPLHQGQ